MHLFHPPSPPTTHSTTHCRFEFESRIGRRWERQANEPRIKHYWLHKRSQPALSVFHIWIMIFPDVNFPRLSLLLKPKKICMRPGRGVSHPHLLSQARREIECQWWANRPSADQSYTCFPPNPNGVGFHKWGVVLIAGVASFGATFGITYWYDGVEILPTDCRLEKQT